MTLLRNKLVRIIILLVLFLFPIFSHSQNARWYISSNTGQPWGSVSNTNGMNTVFGVGGWNAGFFQTIPSMTAICQPTTCFIFIEGGDGTSLLFNTFLQANLVILQNWVAAGGRLFINAAPNVGGNINYGFGGVLLNYSGAPTLNPQGNAAPGQAGHPIFNGPALPAGIAYTGNWFAHAHVTGGGVTNVIIGNNPNCSLAELNWGAGKVMFGGMTTANWHLPAPNSQNLFNNILTYMYVCCPSPTITANATQTNICSGTTVSITASGASAYTFNPGGIMASSIVVSPTATTIYTITGTATTGCIGTQTIAILVNAPTITLSPSPATVCSGQPSTITPSGGSNYTLNPGNFTGNVFTVTPITASVYTVTGLSSLGCPTSETVAISTKTLPIVTPTNFTPQCAGSSLSLAVNVAGSYTWTGPLGFTSSVQFPQIPNATNNMSGIYTVSILGFNSCIGTNTMNVQLNVQAYITPTITPVPAFCNNSPTFNMTVTPSGGGWSGSNIISNAGVVNPGLANTYGTITPITYTVFVGPCLNTQTTSLDVSFYNTAALTASVPNLCVTDPPVDLMTIVQSTIQGSWSGFGTTANPPSQFYFLPGNVPTGIYPVVYSTTSTPNGTACPATSTLNISVTSTLTPSIATISPFCTNAPSMSMAVNPSGGNWYGNVGVGPFGAITPSNCTVGVSTVNYSIQIGPCINTATTSLNVSKFNTAALSGTVPHLCATHNPFNLMTIVQSTAGGVWSGIQPNTNSLNNTFSPANLLTGTYVLTYNTSSFPIPNLCPDSRTVAAYVLNPVSPNISPAGPYCSKDGTVQLSATPNNGYWNASGYLTSSGVLNPAMCGTGLNAVQYIVGTNTCNSSQTKYISVESFVPATIISSIPDLCNTNSPFNLLPLTAHNLGIWSGSGVTGANFDPGVGAGSYVLTYNTASSPSGLCPDQSTLSVKVFSLQTPTIVQPGPFCNKSEPVKIIVNPIGGVFEGANNSAISPSGFFNPALASFGKNIVNYSVSSGPCIAFAQSTIIVDKFVSAIFELGAGPFCNTDNPIDLNSLVQNPNFNWASSAPGSIIGSKFYPSKANTGSNVITYQTHSELFPNLCPDQSTIEIHVDNLELDKVNLSALLSNSCTPATVQFLARDVASANGSWYFSDGTELSSGLSVRHTFLTPGTYSVMFKYGIGACKADGVYATPFSIYASPKADFSVYPDELSITNPEISLTNLSTVLGDNKYVWTIEKMDQRFEVSPTVKLPQAGTYKINLTATTAHGCKDEMTRIIEVKNDFNVFVPNSFTPNEDGVNDTFMPVFSLEGIDRLSFEMEIYDRWGHILYRTKDITKGWDGTLNNKGESVLKQDSYVYKFRFKDNEGKLYERMGFLILMSN